MTGDRDPNAPGSTPNAQYSAGASDGSHSFSPAPGESSPFDSLGTVLEIETHLLRSLSELLQTDLAALGLFRVDPRRDCLVGRMAFRRDEESSLPTELSPDSMRLRRVRFSLQDTELGPVAAVIATTGEAAEEVSSGFEIEDPAELEKILGGGPWSYWPLSGSDRPMGVLCISGQVGDASEPFESILGQAGLALERAENRFEWDRMARQQRRLQDAAGAMSKSHSATELYRRLTRIVARGTSAPWSCFFSVSDSNGELRSGLVAQCGSVPETEQFLEALQSEVDSTSHGQSSRVWAQKPGCVWLVPIRAFDRALGVLAIGRNSDEFTTDIDRDRPFLLSIAGQFAVAIRNCQMTEELRIGKQRYRELQGQLLRMERLASIGETCADLASQTQPAANSIYEAARALHEQLEESALGSEAMDSICRELLRLQSLLREQVDLGRLTKPRLVLCDFDELVRSGLDAISDDARIAGVEVAETISGDMPKLLLDHEKVQDVVRGLLQSVLVDLQRGDRLNVEASCSGSNVSLAVHAIERKDPTELRKTPKKSKAESTAAAASVPEPSLLPETTDLLSRLFAPFSSQQPGGTSLGLSVARQILVDHGGELEIQRFEGRNLRYHFRLPIRDNRDRRAGNDRRRTDRRRAA